VFLTASDRLLLTNLTALLLLMEISAVQMPEPNVDNYSKTLVPVTSMASSSPLEVLRLSSLPSPWLEDSLEDLRLCLVTALTMEVLLEL
jgi:hypothetical protein